MSMRTLVFSLALGLFTIVVHAQTLTPSAEAAIGVAGPKTILAAPQTENLLIIGWDGVRWQEIFTGVDSALMNDPSFTRRSGGMRSQFWSDTVAERRRKLFPFFWSVLAKDGQLYGNRTLGNKVDVTNLYNLTCPGFTETL